MMLHPCKTFNKHKLSIHTTLISPSDTNDVKIVNQPFVPKLQLDDNNCEKHNLKSYLTENELKIINNQIGHIRRMPFFSMLEDIREEKENEEYNTHADIIKDFEISFKNKVAIDNIVIDDAVTDNIKDGWDDSDESESDTDEEGDVRRVCTANDPDSDDDDVELFGRSDIDKILASKQNEAVGN